MESRNRFNLAKIRVRLPEGATDVASYDEQGKILSVSLSDNETNGYYVSLNLVEDDWYLNQTYIKLGICYKELGNFELAKKHLNKGKELTKKSPIEEDIKQKWFKIADLFLAEIELQ